MFVAATTLQIMAWIVFLGGIVAAFAEFKAPGGNFINIIIFVAGGVISGAILFGIGRLFESVEQMAIDQRRTAEALEALVQRRTGVGTLPPGAPKTVPPPTPRQSP